MIKNYIKKNKINQLGNDSQNNLKKPFSFSKIKNKKAK